VAEIVSLAEAVRQAVHDGDAGPGGQAACARIAEMSERAVAETGRCRG
jgi:hypothetical protein